MKNTHKKWMRKAKELCPEVKVVAYDFEEYLRVSTRIYEIFFAYTNMVQAQSIDEAYLQFPKVGVSDPSQLANDIRRDIFKATQCTASAGVAESMLLARVATARAKPNGCHFFKTREDAEKDIEEMAIALLPGFFFSLWLCDKFRERLEELGVKNCRDLKNFTKSHLQREFGKVGETFFNYVRGVDNRSLVIERLRKSVGAEVGWGVRFETLKQVKEFIDDLAEEVSSRLLSVGGKGAKGKKIHLRLKSKHKDAPESTYKFLGQGWCDTVTRCVQLPLATNDKHVIAETVHDMYLKLNVPPGIVRSVGIQVAQVNFSIIFFKLFFLTCVFLNLFDYVLKLQYSDNESKVQPTGSKIIEFLSKNEVNKEEAKRVTAKLIVIEFVENPLRQLNMGIPTNITKPNANETLRGKSGASVGHKHSTAKTSHTFFFTKTESFPNKTKNELVIGSANVPKQSCTFANKDVSSFFVQESFDEIRPSLIKWLNYCEIANDCHYSLLKLYLLDCLEQERLEHVTQVLRCVNWFGTKNDSWQRVVKMLTDEIQAILQKKYCGTLDL
ncbi:terminal deoxycytidyl transferase rev1 [Reticulomyxa filosa]|uniref:DNA repair protein REV1 n=1 Tax=Reticulomyxa filosa TaxID=46433 RepID=X6LX19_RETFI|nr:terminal deoxycytidyl transferase rev1 [Reticulomyxa filosa]|eukprot:ETO06478.1 terminal deoxycytidyl transferase rev1 [Reticulomyxa filosa]